MMHQAGCWCHLPALCSLRQDMQMLRTCILSSKEKVRQQQAMVLVNCCFKS